MEEHIKNLLNNENEYSQILNDCKNALQYPLLNVKRDWIPKDMSKYYGKWVKGWTDNFNWINYGLIYTMKLYQFITKTPIHVKIFKRF